MDPKWPSWWESGILPNACHTHELTFRPKRHNLLFSIIWRHCGIQKNLKRDTIHTFVGECNDLPSMTMESSSEDIDAVEERIEEIVTQRIKALILISLI